MVQIAYISSGTNPDGDNLDYLTKVKKKRYSKKVIADIANNPDQCIIELTETELYFCNILKYEKDYLVLPEPNPVAFYYSLAKGGTERAEEWKKLLSIFFLNKSLLPERLQSQAILFSHVFKSVTLSVVFSFLAIEALLNQLIPEKHEIVRKKKKIGKELIQRYYSFEDKLTKLIPEIFSKDFFIEHPVEADYILQLKRLRDELVHLKNNADNKRTYYTKIYQDILDCDLQKYMGATKLLLNYYKAHTIIE